MSSQAQAAPACAFSDLKGVHPQTAKSLAKAGMTHAFPIQAEVIPVGIAGRDLMVKSPTGSGKTLAFGVPIIEQLKMGTTFPSALILVPTRELAVQVCAELEPIAKGKNLQCAAVYGGASIEFQSRQVRTAAIVVATPGRLDDLRRQRKIDLRQLKILVLDEADRMLDMGFQPQVDEIVNTLRGPRQTLLFSATLDGAVGKVASTYTRDAVVVESDIAPGAGGEIDHVMMATTSGTKVDTVLDALADERDLAVVFVRTKHGADRLNVRLREYGLRSTAIHGGMSQGQRLREYRRFQQGQCDTLVATDVFARGMDLDRITHVINYDLPEDADTYRHRTGRTGRAGRTGTAITMVTPKERGTMKRMARTAGLPDGALDELRQPSGKRWHTVPIEERFTDNVRGGKGSAQRLDRADRENGPRSGRAYGREHGRSERGTTGPGRGAPVGDRGPRRGPGNAPASHSKGPRNFGYDSTPSVGAGVVRSYNSLKGFGFIEPEGGGADVFFHRDRVSEGQGENVKPGMRVAYGAVTHDQGVRASEVRVLEGGHRRK